MERLLHPRSIAVIGGGPWCTSVIEQCQKLDFAGDLWAVHPKRESVGGLKTYPTLESLPGTPDAAFVGINRDATIEAVRVLSEMGAGGAVCFASGFREAEEELGDGHAKQAALLDAAGDMTIIGPNCYGLINYLDRAALWPDIHGGQPVERGVALLTQSSNIALNLTMQRRGLPIAYVATLGNQAQVGIAELGAAMLRDPRVTALGLHIEGIDDLRGYEALAREAEALGKPIVALKVGKSEQAQAATVSHTASLAGSDVGAGALFQRLGIGRVRSLSAFLEALKLLHATGPLRSNRIATLSCSGGEASLIADTMLTHDLTCPPLTTEQRDGLRAALGPKVALANPLDYHTYIWGDADALESTFTAMMAGDLALGIVILDFPREDRCASPDWDAVIDAVIATQRTTGKPMAVLSSISETLPEAVAEHLIAQGIAPLSGFSEAVEAIELATKTGQRQVPAAPLLLPGGQDGRTLSEGEAKEALAAHGVRVPHSRSAIGAEEAALAATQIGFPVALKGQGIAHKSEAGAVALDLTTAEAVRAAVRAMPVEHVLVEEMVTRTVAELLVGVVRDPAHGYVLTLAAGGVLTELLEDSAALLVPASPDAVRIALRTLKVARILDGYRGQPAADLDAIVDQVMALQAYVTAARPAEVEINPLMCGPAGAVAADALIRTGDAR